MAKSKKSCAELVWEWAQKSGSDNIKKLTEKMSVKDADSHAEYCLECMRKHLDCAFVNLGEIEQRLIYNPNPDIKVRKKVESIIADLEAAEQHSLDSVNTTAEEKAVLNQLTDSLRKTRKYLETTKLGYRDERIVPVGGLADIQLAKDLIDNHRTEIHHAIGEIGCGDCDTSEAQMGLIVIRKELKAVLEVPLENEEIPQEEIKEAAIRCEQVEDKKSCVVTEAETIQSKRNLVLPTTAQIINKIVKSIIA